MNRRQLGVVVIFLLSYAVVWLFLASPYRFIPCDDKIFLEPIFNHIPLFQFFLKSIRAVFCAIGNTENSLQMALVWQAILSNIFILSSTVWIIFCLRRRISLAIMGACLYATSAWPAMYYLFASYTVFATSLAHLSLAAVVTAFFSRTSLRRSIFLFLGGIASGAFFLSSPSSPVLISLMVMGVFLFFKSRKPRQSLKEAAFYVLPCLSIIASTLIAHYDIFWYHWQDNLHSGHYVDTLDKFGYLPRVPFFSFFLILKTYSPIIFTSFLILSVIWLIINRNALRDQVLSVYLLGVIISHAILIDLLPFTKLGRTHFVIYPLLLIVLVVMAYDIYKTIVFSRVIQRLYCTVIIAAWACALCMNIHSCLLIVNLKQRTAAFLSRMMEGAEILMLENDPCSFGVEEWLHKGINKVKNLDEIKWRSPKVVFLLGPHGSRSGSNMLRHCCLPDLVIDGFGDKLRSAQKWEFPYYILYPFFFFEEENCEALFFENKVPDWRQDDNKLTVWVWQN